MTTITVKLFGPQARLAQRRELAVPCDTPTPTAGELLVAVGAACPALVEHLATSKIAVNHELASSDAAVCAGDEVALIGMLGGG